MKISTKFLLAILLLGGFLVRLYKINAPLADWHSWRQADTAAVSRNFLKYGYDLLHPRFDDLSNIPSGLDNPKGYRFVEFPIYNLFHAFVFQIFTILGIDLFSFEATGRLISTLFWLMGGYFLFKSVSLLINRRAAFLTLFFFLFLPYGIFYSRTILPDPAMVALSLASIFFLLQSFSVESKIKWLSVFISWLFASTAILVKPYAVFLLSPSWLIIFAKLFLEKQIATFGNLGLSIDGSAYNNVFTCGQRFIGHWNGVSFVKYEELSASLRTLMSINTKSNILCSVGLDYNGPVYSKAAIILGRQ
jgi:hypothetical protein